MHLTLTIKYNMHLASGRGFFPRHFSSNNTKWLKKQRCFEVKNIEPCYDDNQLNIYVGRHEMNNGRNMLCMGNYVNLVIPVCHRHILENVIPNDIN